MATNNSVNAPFPLSATQGGLGAASLTAHGVLVAEGSSPATSIVLAAGDVLIGTTSGDPVAATLTAGTNINITSASGSITIATTGFASFAVTDVSGTSQTAATNSGYIADNAALCTITLPTTIAVGGLIKIIGKGAGGWLIAQSTGQTINFGNVVTTSGAGGSLASTNAHDCIELMCTTANTGFTVLSCQGNITYV